MAQITFDDKVQLVDQPDIADTNKVMADDLNEIKKVVNENDDNAAGTTLYENTTGTSSTTTLNDSETNYSALEIYFKASAANYSGGYVKVLSSDFSNYIALVTSRTGSTYGYNYTALVAISSGTLTFYENRTINISTGAIASDNPILITKIIGYK